MLIYRCALYYIFTSDSGISLTIASRGWLRTQRQASNSHTKRHTCISCAQGKQTNNSQSRRDTGANMPIDRIGIVICSDLKVPMTPKDRLENLYLVNFIDHKSNYCRVFLDPTKDKAAKKFKHCLAFFERRFNCQIHVLHTDELASTRTLTCPASRQELHGKLARYEFRRRIERRSKCTGQC